MFRLQKITHRVNLGGVPTVYGSGHQRSCFTYIDDFIDGLVTTSQQHYGENGTYIVGETQETEIHRLAKLTLKNGGRNCEPLAFGDLDDIMGPIMMSQPRECTTFLGIRNDSFGNLRPL
jgi:nucleoside-diphosphate-sugar epimerase